MAIRKEMSMLSRERNTDQRLATLEQNQTLKLTLSGQADTPTGNLSRPPPLLQPWPPGHRYHNGRDPAPTHFYAGMARRCKAA